MNFCIVGSSSSKFSSILFSLYISVNFLNFKFASVSVAGLFKKVMPKTGAVLTGATLYSLLRLASHIAGGIIFFNLGWVEAELPFFGSTEAMGGFVYSFAYNIIYMLPETILLLGILFYLTKSKHFDTLESILKKAKQNG